MHPAGTSRFRAKLATAGFDPGQPAVVVSTGVTMCLAKDANAATLGEIAGLAPGSTLAITFLLPGELLDDADRAGIQAAENGVRASGTPVISFYTPFISFYTPASASTPRTNAGAGLRSRLYGGPTRDWIVAGRAPPRGSDRRPSPFRR
jgi:O-methyltransferase involved in polyketide biosynthesis